MSSDEILEKVETLTIRMSEEDMKILDELAKSLKNSKSGAVRYAVKYCHNIFTEKDSGVIG